MRIAVLDPSNLIDQVRKHIEKKTQNIHVVAEQHALDEFLASEPAGPYHVVVLIGPETGQRLKGVGLGRAHDHLNPVELTVLNISGKRLRMARFVNY
jgi:hypothetical protein